MFRFDGKFPVNKCHPNYVKNQHVKWGKNLHSIEKLILMAYILLFCCAILNQMGIFPFIVSMAFFLPFKNTYAHVEMLMKAYICNIYI